MATHSTRQSPFGRSFQSAINRGTPVSDAVSNIAKRQGRTENSIYLSLWKGGHIQRQKFNGQWVYWPTQGTKRSASTARETQVELWQSFVEWALASGHVTPEQISSHSSSRQQFISYFRRFWSKQFPSQTQKSSTSTSRRRSTTTKSRRPATKSRSTRRTTAKSRSTTRTRNYRFTSGSSSSTRRLRRAA